jgi:hydroxylamine reductase
MIFGLKGLAAYTHHAAILGQEDDGVYAFIYEALSSLTDREISQNQLVKLVLKVGEVNLQAMALLDTGNTGAFGHPVPTTVPLGHRQGKSLLVSGHDLKDLRAILEQTAGKGINVYTHGEMLPAHGYPELKKYGHLYGHFGTAWQNQKKEFALFPGAIIMTSNCIQAPQESYLENIFTTAMVGYPGAVHLKNSDFGPAVNKALAMPGFAADTGKGSVLTGFARNTVLGVAGKVIDAVKSGEIKHFFLVGGCGGAKAGRSYYSEGGMSHG